MSETRTTSLAGEALTTLWDRSRKVNIVAWIGAVTGVLSFTLLMFMAVNHHSRLSTLEKYPPTPQFVNDVNTFANKVNQNFDRNVKLIESLGMAVKEIDPVITSKYIKWNATPVQRDTASTPATK